MRSARPMSSATRITATAFCVVVTSGNPSSTMPLEVSPSVGSTSTILRASDSLARRALEIVALRGFTSCSCILRRTSLTSGRSVVRSMAIAMACARVMVLTLLMWYLLVPRGVGLLPCPFDCLNNTPLPLPCLVRIANWLYLHISSTFAEILLKVSLG